MADADKAVKLVIALVVGGLMTAFLMPIAIGAIAGPEETTVTLNTSEQIELQPGLNATLDSVDTTADDATYTVTGGSDSATVTVANGTNETVTVDGADVTIEVTDVSTGEATATFESPMTYAWGNGAGALWGILPVILVLAIFLFFVAVALDRL